MKDKINFTDFLETSKKLEIKVGLVRACEDVPKSSKLIKLEVYFSDDDIRTVVTNIKPLLSDKSILEGNKFLFITNLEKVTMMGIESSAMIMPGQLEDGKMVTINSESGVSVL